MRHFFRAAVCRSGWQLVGVILTRNSLAALFKIFLKGFGHLVAVLSTGTIVALFPILKIRPINAPRWTTSHDVKDVQQVVNLLTIVVAAILGLYLQYCLSVTNEAVTAAALRRERLTLPRLHAHGLAQSNSLASLLKGLTKWSQAQSIRWVILCYLLAWFILGGVSSVLGALFVVEIVPSVTSVPSDSFAIVIGANVPSQLDQCAAQLFEDTCTYDLAASALSSQLITHTAYTMGGVRFRAPNGTFGLPYGALTHFARTVNESLFRDEKRQYCLPVLDRKLVTCKRDEGRVFYDPEPLSTREGFIVGITIDPSQKTSHSDYARLLYRLEILDGTMVIAQSRVPADLNTTIITATGEYGDILSHLMTGEASKTGAGMQDRQFTAACEMHDLTLPGHSSWRWVSMILDGGVISVDVTDEDCTNEMDTTLSHHSTGFMNLDYAFEATTQILGGVDGYSKLINYHSFNTRFSELTLEEAQAYARAANMTLLESLLSQMLGIIHTSWTAIVRDTDNAVKTPIMQRDFPHLYIIKTVWNPITIVAATVAALILLITVGQAICWLLAVRILFKEGIEWELLDLTDLMIYSATAEDLRRHVSTTAGGGHCKTDHAFILREHARSLAIGVVVCPPPGSSTSESETMQPDETSTIDKMISPDEMAAKSKEESPQDQVEIEARNREDKPECQD